MKGLLRPPLGIVGTGILWAVAWAGLDGALLSLPAALGVSVDPVRILTAIFFAGLLGFAGGSAFGVVLTILEYHNRLEDLSVKWIAVGEVSLVWRSLLSLAPAIGEQPSSSRSWARARPSRLPRWRRGLCGESC